MSKQFDKSKLIAYVHGELFDDEALALLRELERNEDLASEFELLTKTSDLLSAHLRTPPMESLTSEQTGRIRSKAHPRAKRLPYYILGGSLVAAGLAAVIYIQQHAVDTAPTTTSITTAEPLPKTESARTETQAVPQPEARVRAKPRLEARNVAPRPPTAETQTAPPVSEAAPPVAAAAAPSFGEKSVDIAAPERGGAMFDSGKPSARSDGAGDLALDDEAAQSNSADMAMDSAAPPSAEPSSALTESPAVSLVVDRGKSRIAGVADPKAALDFIESQINSACLSEGHDLSLQFTFDKKGHVARIGFSGSADKRALRACLSTRLAQKPELFKATGKLPARAAIFLKSP